jgi:hypothetical protein
MIAKPGVPSSATLGLSASLNAPRAGSLNVAPRKIDDLPVESVTAGVFAVEQSTAGLPIMRDDFVTYTGPLTSRI